MKHHGIIYILLFAVFATLSSAAVQQAGHLYAQTEAASDNDTGGILPAFPANQTRNGLLPETTAGEISISTYRTPHANAKKQFVAHSVFLPKRHIYCIYRE